MLNSKKSFLAKSVSIILILCVLVSTCVISGMADVHTAIESFNAVTTVREWEAKNLWTEFNDNIWSFEEKKLAKDEVSGLYLPTGDWFSSTIKKGNYCSATAGIQNALPNMYYVWDGNGGTGRGLATYSNRVVTYTGNGCPAPTLTFTAPYSGTVKLYDPNNLKVGTSGTGDPFWTLDGSAEKIGFAIYKNNEKIWPADADYYTLTQSQNNISFPEIDNLIVKSGDKIRMMFIPIANGWGYCSLAPQIDYISKDSYISDFNSYNTVKAWESKDLWTEFNDNIWSFEEKKLDKTEDVFKPTGDWYSPVIKKGNWSSIDDQVRTAIPNMYYIWDGDGNNGRGLATYNNRVITFVGAACPAPTLTFNAPYTGTVKLYDPNALKVSGGSVQAPFWALDNDKEKIGFVVYKNNEKIWPADKDYYTLSQSENSIDFPVIDNLSVNSGDKIRMMFIPLDGNAWGYYALAPQVKYLSITDSSLNEASVIGLNISAQNQKLECFNDEAEVDYSQLSVALQMANGTTVPLVRDAEDINKKFVIQAATFNEMVYGKNAITVSYDNEIYKYNSDFNVIKRCRGDINGNNVIDSGDLSSVRGFKLGKTESIEQNAVDMDRDAEITLIDLLKIKKSYSAQ